jgi:hypothetical protein
MMNPAWPERIDCGHVRTSQENGRKTDLWQSRIASGFWPAAKTGKGVSGWLLCPRVHARPIAVIASVNDDEEIGACRRRRPTQVRSRGGLSRFVTYDIDLATNSRDIIGAQDFLQNAECDGANS